VKELRRSGHVRRCFVRSTLDAFLVVNCYEAAFSTSWTIVRAKPEDRGFRVARDAIRTRDGDSTGEGRRDAFWIQGVPC